MSDPSYQSKPMVQGGIVQFGKHTGERVEDLSLDYLAWYCKMLYDQMEEKRAWAVEELKRRGIKVAK
jgi:hypothetical protein